MGGESFTCKFNTNLQKLCVILFVFRTAVKVLHEQNTRHQLNAKQSSLEVAKTRSEEFLRLYTYSKKSS